MENIFNEEKEYLGYVKKCLEITWPSQFQDNNFKTGE